MYLFNLFKQQTFIQSYATKLTTCMNKNFKMKNVVLIFTIIVMVLLAGLTGTIAYYNSIIDKKNVEIQSLLKEREQIKIWLDKNLTLLTSLVRERDDLQQENIRLQDWLNKNKTYYEQQITILQNQISNMNKKMIELENTIKSYQVYKQEYQSFKIAYQNLRNIVNQRIIHSNVTLFITPYDLAVNEIVYKITGGWSNPSDINEFWKDIKALYNWILNNIEYRSDGLYPILPLEPYEKVNFEDEMWQFSNETLKLKKGDCEDMAILLCSMIRCYVKGRYPIEVIAICSETSGHAALQIPVSGYKLVILDPAGKYYSQDALGNIIANDIKAEISRWINYWKPSMGGNIQVSRVFSDEIDKEFTSTNEYLAWMYSR